MELRVHHFEHNYSYSLSTHFRNFHLMNSRIKTGKRGSSNQTSIERKVNSCILTLQDAELFSRSELLVRKWILTGGSGGTRLYYKPLDHSTKLQYIFNIIQ